MNQDTKGQEYNKNEQEISNNMLYYNVYRKMVSQMARNSDDQVSNTN